MDLSTSQIVLALLVVIVPVIAIAAENSEKRLTRRDYISWVAAAVIVNIGTTQLAEFDGGLVATFAAFAISISVYFLLLRATVQRARDAAVGKSYCYLAIIPLFALVLMVVLLIAPSKTNWTQRALAKAQAKP